ncbi:DUF6779 domain-containing protein [Kutzneria sp. NPDC052558]|uniref:DUF6779 domain-containing protein n=1 Tax=Kutzneria sp. NPDC052558 TaxID=3364121 RepID=UPI0037CAA1E4
MTGRSGLTEGERGDSRGYGRLLLVAVLVLAIAATAVLVLSNDARFLRLGVLSALWAALVGAFLAVKYRREAAASEDEVADLQAVYELELEREVAARREYELEIEADTRRRVEEESREDLEALRGELRALRENLEALLGGEVLVERVALRAESTRMRSLSDQSRLLAVGEDRLIASAKEERKPITVGTVRKEAAAVPAPADKTALPTEMIERIAHEVQRKDQAPRRPEPSRPEQVRQPVRTATAQTDALSRPATQPRREPQRPAQPAATQFVSRPGAAKPPEARPAAPAQPRQPEPRQPEPRQPESRQPEPRQPEPRKPEPRQPEARPAGMPNVVGMRVRPPEPSQPVPKQPARAPEVREPRRPDPRQPAQRAEQTMAMRLNPETKAPLARQPEPARPAEASGRRRRPEAEAAAVAPDTSGRRRRPEPAAPQPVPAAEPPMDGPVWDPELGDWVPNSLEMPIPVRTAPAVTPPPAPAAPPPPPAAPPVVDTGAHAAGKSVSELLASLGQEESRGRRRRRSED